MWIDRTGIPKPTPPMLETHCQGLSRSLPLWICTRADNATRSTQSEVGKRELGYETQAYTGQI